MNSAAAAAQARHDPGTPLVRWHRAVPDPGWSYLCPVPDCQYWSTGHQTEAACHRWWAIHARDAHGWLAVGWPDTSGIVLPRRWEPTREAVA